MQPEGIRLDEPLNAHSSVPSLARTIDTLRAYGVRYLLPEPPASGGVAETAVEDAGREWDGGCDGAPLPASLLFVALARTSVPRVRDAIVSLLLLHPELCAPLLHLLGRETLGQADLDQTHLVPGDDAERTTGDTPQESTWSVAKEQLAIGYLATVYLQRLWYPEIVLALAVAPNVPEAPAERMWQERGLPAPTEDYGAAGLHALEHYAHERIGYSAPTMGDWRNQLAHLVQDAWRERLAHGQLLQPLAYPPLLPPVTGCPTLRGVSQHHTYEAAHKPFPEAAHTPEQARASTGACPSGESEITPLMSIRPPVRRDDIERFLQELGRMVRSSGRVYLAGGAELVHAQLRGIGASTEDIDLKLDVTDNQEVETALRTLKTRLGMNVELASPADFIPLPSAWQRMSRFVGRYGALDVFYFDFVTLALAKIDRGQSRDLLDVGLLAQQGMLQRSDLEAALREILPQLGHGRFFNIDPQVFEQKAQAVIAHLWSTLP